MVMFDPRKLSDRSTGVETLRHSPCETWGERGTPIGRFQWKPGFFNLGQVVLGGPIFP